MSKLVIAEGLLNVEKSKVTIAEGNVTVAEGKVTVAEDKLAIVLSKLAVTEDKLAISEAEIIAVETSAQRWRDRVLGYFSHLDWSAGVMFTGMFESDVGRHTKRAPEE